MNVIVKILGHRQGITKIKRSDGSFGYLPTLIGEPGKQQSIQEQAIRQRGIEFNKLHTKFHRV